MQPVEFEREARRRLPELLASLVDDPAAARQVARASADKDVDAILDAGGWRWLLEIKSSSSPGVVATAAAHLASIEAAGGQPTLVVPHMTPAGARAADERRLNWIDLSGNAHLRADQLHIWVQGRPSAFATHGRPSSAFAPKSSRIARVMLLEPARWWRQKELSERTGLDAGHISRIVRRLGDDALIERDGTLLRPRDPDLLLDAWADEYRFDRHDIITGHLSGDGVELAHALTDGLRRTGIEHAVTGLPAAYLLNRFARFRLVSVYVEGDPRESADALDLRRNERGANVQLIGPYDSGVFDGGMTVAGLACVAPVQVYLDLLNLPERAIEAAEELRADAGLWGDRG